jgi:hypothetical protein
MKLKTNWLYAILACVCALCFASFAHAADETIVISEPGFTAQTIVQWLTPIIVPLVITGVKKIAPSIPTWLIPVLAPILGMILDIINTAATNNSSNLLVGALLGLAGVGVREIKTNIIRPKDEVPV